ncbi:unnamed protein product [Amoebophrya sp. A120]|nr:unnamed protein product [Amoebophrya sp. A120]|eukprot:GSA120T00017670001.1
MLVDQGADGTPRGEQEEKVATIRDFGEDERCHRQLASGRYVTLVRHGANSDYYCIDSNCYHMGGPLGAGDIEDVLIPAGARKQNKNNRGPRVGTGPASSSSADPGSATGSLLAAASSLFYSAASNLSLFGGGAAGSSSPRDQEQSQGATATLTPSTSTGGGTENGTPNNPAAKKQKTEAESGEQQNLPPLTSADDPTRDLAILCPWHMHRISLTTGRKYTESVKPHVDPVTGQFSMKKSGLQESATVFQQVHRVRVDPKTENIYVSEQDFQDGIAENPYAFDGQCAANLCANPTGIHSNSRALYGKGGPPPSAAQDDRMKGGGDLPGGGSMPPPGGSSLLPPGAGRTMLPPGGGRGKMSRPGSMPGTSSASVRQQLQPQKFLRSGMVHQQMAPPAFGPVGSRVAMNLPQQLPQQAGAPSSGMMIHQQLSAPQEGLLGADLQKQQQSIGEEGEEKDDDVDLPPRRPAEITQGEAPGAADRSVSKSKRPRSPDGTSS